MASSLASSSSQLRKWNYDVFLSFRGEDTRKTFTSHLYEGLNRMGIVTFQDDKRLEHGTSISIELCKAIEESQFAIIVFSINYASSGWCLDELVKIMKCKEEYGQTVIPVFYDVDPSIIRHQKGSFAEAFAKHESRYKVDVEGMQKVQGWRSALTEAANLSGHDIRNRIEAECIQQIVNEIFVKLCKTTHLSSLQDVVGISAHLEKVKSLLEIEINDVRIIGIWGMGGVGKTTITRAIFDTLSFKFEAACFLADVKENKKLHSLQNTLLSELLRKNDHTVNNEHDGKSMMSTRLRLKKVLIVLDDIDHNNHLEYLAGDLGWFGKGSRIIVTTRDKHLIKNDDVVYQVTTLPHREAFQLFNQHAFKKEVPDNDFEKLSLEIVNHAKGLPLALKVWGAFLHKRNIVEWKSAIEQMKNNANSEIVEKLKISYDGLGATEQQIFLDIACFFRGYSKNFVMPILDSCFVGANVGLSVLIERSLVVISKNNKIEMHDLIQEMGKYVGKGRGVWLVKDYFEVMTNNMGTETIEAIWIKNPPKLQISKKALKHMNRLRILGLDEYSGEDKYTDNEDDDRISFHDDTFKYLSNNLSYFGWKGYRGESLPDNFEPKRLVHLELTFSSLRHLWKGKKDFRYLQKLYLYGSLSLIETPDFRGMPNLKYLDLSYCSALEEVHPSLGNCTKLIWLYLDGCISLKRFPRVNVESLTYLNLNCCTSLEKFPEIIGSMKSESPYITKLNLFGLHNIVTLPNSICKLKSLVILNVSQCSKLESLPEDIGDLENLEQLHAHDTHISRPPPSIVHLNKLKILRFDKRQVSEDHFVFPWVNQGLRSLEELNLTNCNLIDGGLPEDIGCLSTLKRLHLKATNCDPLPRSIAQLGALEVLDVSFCKRLRELPELPPNVEQLKADCCVGPSIQNYQNLKLLIFTEVEFDDSIGDLFAQTLLKCILSLRKAFSASDSLSQRVFKMWHPPTKIPNWFKYDATPGRLLLAKLPESWYVIGKFLGFAICYYGASDEIVVELIPSSNDDESEKLSKRLAVPPSRETMGKMGVSFYFIPLAGLWDTSKANGKTPNAYGHLKFSLTQPFACEYGFRLLYKDDPGLGALLEELEHNHNHKRKFGEHHDSMTNEVSCSFSKKQMSHSNIRGSSIFENLPQREEGPSTSGLLQLSPENPGS